MLKDPQSSTTLVTPARCWSDYNYTAGKDIILDLYHKLNLRLDTQKCLENRHQASVFLHSPTKDVCICRYLYSDNGIATRGENLGLILTPEKIVTLRHGNDLLFASLSQTLAPLPAQEITPSDIFQTILQKIYHSTVTVLLSFDETLSSWQQDLEKDGSLPESRELSHMHAALGEAASIVSGHQQLLNSFPATLGLSATGVNSRSYGLLQAECANMQLVLNSCLFTLSALQKAREQELLERNTAAIHNLTTLCAVFLPIIFIAALYGMRFENMPELKAAWGYVICVAVMAVVALVAWWQSR
jgi:Mg2+ and Co2+ transporter CorA